MRIQNIDSDGDGFSNIGEINARTLPGDGTSVPNQAAGIPVPVSGQMIVFFEPISIPLADTDPAQAKPVGIGTAAIGGDTFTLNMNLEAFAGPVDLYVALAVPPSVSSDILLLTPTGVQPISAGFTPLVSNQSAEFLLPFPSFDIEVLPAGSYVVVVAATPPGAGNLDSSYIWVTAFNISHEVTITTTLSGSQVVPPVTTAGTGTATLTVNTATGAVGGSLTFSGLNSNALVAHIHQGAAGTNGPVILDLTGGAGATSGTWTIPVGSTLTPDRIDALKNNGLYYQVHSQSNPSGELRGQILNPVITITTTLSGSQVVPSVTTSGTGTANVTFNTITGAIAGAITFSGLTGNSLLCHIHQGAAGANGPVIVDLEGGAGATSGIWFFPPSATLLPAEIDALRNDGLYYQLHSTTSPGGELRGQVAIPVRFDGRGRPDHDRSSGKFGGYFHQMKKAGDGAIPCLL